MRTVAFDFSGLDHLSPGNGQYRYCIDLVRGLSRLPSDFHFIVIGSRPRPPDQIAAVFDAPSWRYIHVPRIEMRGAYYFDQLRYARLLLRERVDVFHTPHTFVPMPALSLGRATREGGWRTVVTVHDLMSEIFPEYRERAASRPYRRFKRAVQSHRTQIIAISQATAADLDKYWNVPAERVSVVPHGPEIAEAQRPANRLRNVADTRFVLSPYNLEPRKNLQALLTAMTDVRRAHGDVRLVLYGRAAVTPDREAAFRAQVRALGLDAAIVLTDFVSDQSLAWLYRMSTLFVFPTLYEGFGLPVVEAMAAGACVVARNQSAMAEILGEAGIQVDTSDPSQLSAAMIALLGEPGRRAELGRAARDRAALYSQEAMSRGTVAAYKRALERG
jgi:glycosyltransferase involved in cell wall biosynthesis